MEKEEKLNEHLNRLEDRLRANFLEIEKRFSQLNVNLPPDIDERLQEIEDLLLLMQVENMKIKAKINDQIDIGPRIDLPDIETRILSLEKKLDMVESPKTPTDHVRVDPSIGNRLETIEQKLEGKAPQSLIDEIRRIEERIGALEHEPVSRQVPQEPQLHVQKSNLLEDIQHMLKTN